MVIRLQRAMKRNKIAVGKQLFQCNRLCIDVPGIPSIVNDLHSKSLCDDCGLPSNFSQPNNTQRFFIQLYDGSFCIAPVNGPHPLTVTNTSGMKSNFVTEF